MTDDFDRRYACLLAYAQDIHDDFIAENRAVFFDYPPDDEGSYAYTYYDRNGEPLYHGYTTEVPGCSNYVFGSPFGRKKLTCSNPHRVKMQRVRAKELAAQAGR